MLQREDKSTKRDYTLMPLQYEERIIDRFQLGARKYKPHDWLNATLKDRPSYYASLHRHLRQAQNGDRDEDHLAALVVDAIILMHIESTPGITLQKWLEEYAASQ